MRSIETNTNYQPSFSNTMQQMSLVQIWYAKAHHGQNRSTVDQKHEDIRSTDRNRNKPSNLTIIIKLQWYNLRKCKSLQECYSSYLLLAFTFPTGQNCHELFCRHQITKRLNTAFLHAIKQEFY